MSATNPIARSNRRQDLVASSGQTVFGPNQFIVFDPLDVRVRRRDPATGRFVTLTSGFAVTLASAAPANPVVTFTSGRAAGDVIRIEGARVAERSTDVTLAGIVRAPRLEAELDRNVIQDQETRRDLDDVFGSLATVDAAVVTTTANAGVATTKAAEAAASAVAAAASAASFDTALNLRILKTSMPINALDYIPSSVLLAGTSCSAYLNQAFTDAVAQGRREVYLPPLNADYVIGATIDVKGCVFFGTSKGWAGSARLVTSADIVMLTSSLVTPTIADLSLEHHGSGDAISLDVEAARVEGLRIGLTPAVGNAGTGVGMLFRRSNTYLHDCEVTNLRSGYSVIVDRAAGGININSRIRDLYMGGTGKGVWIGSTDNAGRQEGLSIEGLKSIVTGGPAIELYAGLSTTIINPMCDQAPTNAILLAGNGPYGVDDVQIIGGWLSAPNNMTTGRGLLVQDGANGIANIIVSGVSLRYANTGAFVQSNTCQATFVGCNFCDLSSNVPVYANAANVSAGRTKLVGCNFGTGIGGLTGV